MAGKEIYIGRMLAALETSMNHVSSDMQNAAAILEKIYENQGLQKQQQANSGAALVALNPVLESKYVPELPAGDTRFSIDENGRLALNAPYQSTNLVNVLVFLKLPASLHREQDLTFKCHYKFGNVAAYTALSGQPAYFYVVDSKQTPGGVPVPPVFNFTEDSIPSTQRTEKEVEVSGVWRKKADYAGPDPWVRVAFWNIPLSNTGLEYWCEALDENGVSLWRTGTLVNDDNVLGINGEGSLTFPLSVPTAAELSDALVTAQLNEGDTVDLLDASGTLVSADVGKEILLSELDALAFKLRFNLTTGSRISGIAVRYY